MVNEKQSLAASWNQWLPIGSCHTERAGALWKAREQVREELEKRAADMHQRARENGTLIAELLYGS